MTKIPRNKKSVKYPTNAPTIDRCPGCLGYPGNIRALAVYVHKATGRTFSYALCNKCTVRLGINPQAIIANVESYFSEEIAKMDAEAKAARS